MRAPLPSWVMPGLAAAGVVMVVSIFFAWIDVGPLSLSGLQIARMGDHWMWIVPAAGALLAAAAATRSPYTRLAALVAGLAVAGDVVFEIAKSMLHMPVEGWLILGGAAVILIGVPERRRALRAVGGLAVIAGFFAAGGIDATREAPGWIACLLWAIPVAGAVAGVSGVLVAPRARWLALGAGAAVYGVLLVLLVVAAYEVFGLGAWAAFGASAVALAASLLVPGVDGAGQPARDKKAK
jgi:hypothetical protein